MVGNEKNTAENVSFLMLISHKARRTADVMDKPTMSRVYWCIHSGSNRYLS
jgi:hypothetical protein